MISVLAEVILGSPVAACAKFGICQMEMLPPAKWCVFKPHHLRHAKVVLSPIDKHSLCLQFPFDGMMPAARDLFFPAEGFRVEAVKVLPPPIARALGVQIGCSLDAGLYPVTIFPGSLVVKIAISPFKAECITATFAK